ncbi:MAG: glycerol-3-phosphate 1-O-acyltransferase PlsY [candidate division Zixibacteria bacterium]|nr:glycerol-3-phosphate 1-O-acyltransferase PlsY [candidate division Zixibacteria bacterium]
MIILLILIILSYLAGSIPSGVWVGRMVGGIDIRAHGSGNPGATNVARVLGAPWGILVGVIDAFKGFAPVWWLGPIAASNGTLAVSDARLLIGAAAILGHLYPLFAGFRGGKGVLTALGVFVALLPVESAVAALVWIVVFAASRIVSLGSLAASLALLAAVVVRRLVFHIPIPNSLMVAAIAIAALVFLTHRANIRRLLNGTESRFGRR